jgi:hypothetical protein
MNRLQLLARVLSDPAAGKAPGSYSMEAWRPRKSTSWCTTADGPANFERVSGFIADPVEVPGELWKEQSWEPWAEPWKS